MTLRQQKKPLVPRWQYEAFKRWFNKDASESRKIAAEAARQAGER